MQVLVRVWVPEAQVTLQDPQPLQVLQLPSEIQDDQCAFMFPWLDLGSILPLPKVAKNLAIDAKHRILKLESMPAENGTSYLPSMRCLIR